MIEGPHIPRSCDPDWGFRNESGNYTTEWYQLPFEKRSDKRFLGAELYHPLMENIYKGLGISGNDCL